MTTGRPVQDDGPDPSPASRQRPQGAPSRWSVSSQRLLTELAGIELAQEELRAAAEEMQAQQEQISRLLLQNDAERRWRGQLSALVPVGLCLTDGNGVLIETNPALAVTLGAGPNRLRGTQLSDYLAADDVASFRSELRALSARPLAEHRLTVVVRPRDGTPARMILFGFTETADERPSAARVQWILTPEAPAPTPSETAPPARGAPEPGPTSEMLALATALAELSALPVSEPDRQRLLGRMATLVRGAVPGADWASITLGSPFEPQRLGSDSAQAQDFDGRQVRAGEGPCLEAYDTGSVVLTEDVTVDPRWPALGPVAAGSRVRSVLSLPVQEDGTTTGAVNIYSGEIGAFGTGDRRIAELATAAVASVLQTVAERESVRRLAENLERAMTSRAVIDQAKGMIMALLGVDADEAFARLVNLSSRMNVKVRDLARLIVEGQVDALLHAAE